ncbi:tyrosine-type recombinase/integrase [Ruegeria sp.]|uniref:tyrosine-type recombinase/integrase n=1 Tax=Ruegeria sp. TaxID=1879320 RepID=UPI003C7BC411
MRVVRLTDARSKQFKPTAREYSVQDKAVPSLSLRVYPTGTKTWTCIVDGRKVSLGRVELMPVEDARRACLRLQVDGVAPSKDLPTYRVFVEDVWRETWSSKCKPTTIKGRDYVLTRQLLPAFGSLRLDLITRKSIEKWFGAYSATAPGGANHALQLLRQSLNFAIERGLIDSNPAGFVLPNRRPKLTRFLSRDEIARLNAALDQYADGRGSIQADIIRLLLLTGCRRNEIVRLRRFEVDGNRLRLIDSKTGPRTVYLSPEARKIIERRMTVTGEYLFPSPLDPERPISKNLCLWYRIRRDIGIEDVRLHDLRHSYASQCVMAGIPLPVVSKLLGHSDCAMTLRYTHAADKDVEAAAERIGARIAKLLKIPDQADLSG